MKLEDDHKVLKLPTVDFDTESFRDHLHNQIQVDKTMYQLFEEARKRLEGLEKKLDRI